MGRLWGGPESELPICLARSAASLSVACGPRGWQDMWSATPRRGWVASCNRRSSFSTAEVESLNAASWSCVAGKQFQMSSKPSSDTHTPCHGGMASIVQDHWFCGAIGSGTSFRGLEPQGTSKCIYFKWRRTDKCHDESPIIEAIPNQCHVDGQHSQVVGMLERLPCPQKKRRTYSCFCCRAHQ